MNPGDSERVRRVLDGDPSAFEELVRIHQGRIVTLCARMLGSREVGEEIAQDVFVAAYRKLSSFRGEAQFGTWLYRIAINRCKNHRAYQARRHMAAHEPIDREIATESGTMKRELRDPDAPVADVELVRDERRGLVRRAMEGLSAEHREILTLRDLEDLNYDEIADMLGLSAGTVKSRLHRARQALKELLIPMMHQVEEAGS